MPNENVLNCIFKLSDVLKGVYSSEQYKYIATLLSYLLFIAKNTDTHLWPVSDFVTDGTLYNSELDNYGEEVSLSVEHLIKKHLINTKIWADCERIFSEYEADVFAQTTLFLSSSEFGTRFCNPTPDSVCNLAVDILKIRKSEKVADLGCGSGSFMVSLFKRGLLGQNQSEINYFGVEISTQEYAISQIRASLLRNTKVVSADMFDLVENRYDIPYKFDKIFSQYPWNLSINHVAGEGLKSYIRKFVEEVGGQPLNCDWIFNKLICDLLEEDGKAVVIMPTGRAWNTSDIIFRKYFIEQGLIEAVVNLPENLFSDTNIATSLVVFSKGNHSIRLVDATKLYEKGRRFNEITPEYSAKILDALKHDSDYSKTVCLEELADNGYVLTLSHYMIDVYSKYKNSVRFESVIKTISRAAQCSSKDLDAMISNNPTNKKYLTLSNIQNGIIDKNLQNVSDIPNQYKRYCLEDDMLVIGKAEPYKTAVVKIPENTEILANGNYYIIRLDKTIVNPYYVNAFFESQNVKSVLKHLSVGTAMRIISTADLQRINIPIPSMEEQNRIADLFLAAMDEYQMYQQRTERALSKLNSVFDDNYKE